MVLSVDKDTAKNHDLYQRKTWEDLLARKIDVLADQMGIKRKDFCWVASMHYEYHHPHVHIMYWDNSDAVRQEFVPEERFEIMAEKVRAAFNREIFQEEIPRLQKEIQGQQDIIRLELRAMLAEANLAEALNLSHITAPTQDRLTAGLAELAATAPTKGALKYAYLKGEYKEKLGSYVEEILKISDFQRSTKQNEKAVRNLSVLFGNSEGQQQFEVDKARETLKKKLGNEVLDTIRDYRKELMLDAPTEHGDLQIVLQGTASVLIKGNPVYQELLADMPKQRTPTGELLKDDAFRQGVSKLTGQICDDIRISAKIYGYVNANNEGLSKEEIKEQLKGIYAEARKSIFDMTIDQLRADAGYPEQARADMTARERDRGSPGPSIGPTLPRLLLRAGETIPRPRGVSGSFIGKRNGWHTRSRSGFPSPTERRS